MLIRLREYAEVCFVPSSLSTSKKGYEFRYIATREALQEQRVLPGTPPKEYPFPVATIGKNRYKIHDIVTNRDVLAPDLVAWYHKRCGHSEEVHAILKNDLAGGTLPFYSAKNQEALRRAAAQMEAGKTVVKSLDELRGME
jgi:hypothetical protein